MSDSTQKQRSSADRFFFGCELKGRQEGWYYQAREGIFGPFETKEAAEAHLAQLITRNPVPRRELFQYLGLSVSHLNDE